MVAPLELMRMRLLVFPWDKMHMKMVIRLCRCVMPPCVNAVLGFLRECSILVHCLILLISDFYNKN